MEVNAALVAMNEHCDLPPRAVGEPQAVTQACPKQNVLLPISEGVFLKSVSPVAHLALTAVACSGTRAEVEAESVAIAVTCHCILLGGDICETWPTAQAVTYVPGNASRISLAARSIRQPLSAEARRDENAATRTYMAGSTALLKSYNGPDLPVGDRSPRAYDARAEMDFWSHGR